jgi:hypothetical protein
LRREVLPQGGNACSLSDEGSDGLYRLVKVNQRGVHESGDVFLHLCPRAGIAHQGPYRSVQSSLSRRARIAAILPVDNSIRYKIGVFAGSGASCWDEIRVFPGETELNASGF